MGAEMTEPRIEWLRKQIDEDEAVVAYSGPARVAWLTYRGDDRQLRYTTVAASHGDYDPWTANGVELPEPASARVVFDPAQVRREVAAKRQILARYNAWQKSLRGGAESPAPSVAIRVLAAMLHDIVADLAAVYSDRDGYAEHWGSHD